MGLTKPWLIVHTSPRTSRIVVLCIHLVLILCAVKHWVSRWRRCLALLRKQHATMDFHILLHSVPEALGLVHSFC